MHRVISSIKDDASGLGLQKNEPAFRGEALLSIVAVVLKIVFAIVKIDIVSVKIDNVIVEIDNVAVKIDNVIVKIDNVVVKIVFVTGMIAVSHEKTGVVVLKIFLLLEKMFARLHLIPRSSEAGLSIAEKTTGERRR